MSKIKLFLVLLLSVFSFQVCDAKKKKKKLTVPVAFLDVQGQKTIRAHSVFGTLEGQPRYGLDFSRYTKKLRSNVIFKFPLNTPDFKAGDSFTIVGNASEVGEVSLQLALTNPKKRKRFYANNHTGTVTITAIEKGWVYLSIIADTTNGKLTKTDKNGEVIKTINEKQVFWELEMPFRPGYITRYKDSCFQPRDLSGAQLECVTTIDDDASFKN